MKTKKISKSNFYKNGKLFNIHDLDVNKILVSKKNHTVQKIHLNTLLIMLDSVIRVYKKYYPWTLLEECKYVIRKNKIENFINDGLDLSSSDESDNASDESDNASDNGTDDESNSDTDN